MADKPDLNRRGRRIALVIAGTGVAWIAATALGQALDWSQRLRALFDLMALAGFGWAIWMIYGLWRARQKHEG
jgi:threonine/homoserine/homoserine lactone efflux protein